MIKIEDLYKWYDLLDRASLIIKLDNWIKFKKLLNMGPE